MFTLQNEFSCASQVFRQMFISFTKPPLHERRQSVGKMVGVAVKMKNAKGDLEWRELGWKRTGWKAASLKQEGEFCHEQYLFSQHPSGCASLPATERWMTNRYCLRKTLPSPCQSLQELAVLTAVRWKYGPINSVWHHFQLHNKRASWYLRRKELEKYIHCYLCQLSSFVKEFRQIIFIASS